MKKLMLSPLRLSSSTGLSGKLFSNGGPISPNLPFEPSNEVIGGDGSYHYRRISCVGTNLVDDAYTDETVTWARESDCDGASCGTVSSTHSC